MTVSWAILIDRLKEKTIPLTVTMANNFKAFLIDTDSSANHIISCSQLKIQKKKQQPNNRFDAKIEFELK